MGTTQHKSDTSVKETIYKFQPFKLYCHSTASRAQNASGTRGVLSPKPRSGHRIVCDDVNMYSYGGYNPSLNADDEADLSNDSVWQDNRPLFRELWKFNIPTSTWTKLNVEKIPDILASNAVLLSGHILMVYGGTGVPFGANCSKDLYICDLQSGTQPVRFSLISAMGNCPQPQYGQAILLIDHFLYTVGGTTGFEYTCDIHRLNLKDGMWEAVYTCKGTDNEPRGRYRHEVAFYDNKIYVLGGGTANEAFGFRVLFAFNLSTNVWEKIVTRSDDKAIEAYPLPRRCHSCVQQNEYVYVIGGFTGRAMLKDIWRIDLTTFQWKRFRKFSMDRGVYFHSSCLSPSGKLFTFGGIVQSENTSRRSSSVHSAWLCIPKLKEICWDAVMFYYPNLNSLSKEELILLGLPTEFISRLNLP